MAVTKITIIIPYMEFIWQIRTEIIILFLFCNITLVHVWDQDMMLPEFQFHRIVKSTFIMNIIYYEVHVVINLILCLEIAYQPYSTVLSKKIT